MGKISDNLRSGRRTLRRINKAMARSSSKAEVFDLEMYKDTAIENLRGSRRR